MKPPPNNDPDWHDTATAIAGLALAAALAAAAWHIATQTGVARRPN